MSSESSAADGELAAQQIHNRESRDRLPAFPFLANCFGTMALAAAPAEPAVEAVETGAVAVPATPDRPG